MNEKDKEVLTALFKNGCRSGDTLTELAAMTGFTVQRIATVAKKYDGFRFKAGVIEYIPPQAGSMKSAAPGIRNPRTGICQRMPAEVIVRRRRKTL